MTYADFEQLLAVYGSDRARWPLEARTLASELVARNRDHQVLIAADESLPYRNVVAAIDLIRGAGVTKYALKVVRPK